MTCKKCNDLGVIIYERNGEEFAKICDCVKAKQSLLRLKSSGLDKLLDKYTFDRYKADFGYQKEFLAKARKYLGEKDKWFLAVGQSGSAKTHICTAICGELLKQGKEVRFMSWLTESVKLKQNINNAEIYEPLINDYKTCEVLYVDDLFKSDNESKPSSADIKLANEIFNYRYNNRLQTLVSCERLISELIEIDQAVAGRIIEMSEPYITQMLGREKNYRLRNFL